MHNHADHAREKIVEAVRRVHEREEMDVQGGTCPSTAGENPPNTPRSGRKRGGWRAIAFILGNESFEKLASMSLIANITTYLHNKYNMDGILVVNVVGLWSGSSNITPLLGAFLADAYIGRFLTLLLGSIAAFLGMGMIALTAGIHKLRPSDCHGGSNCSQPQYWQLGFLFTGLGFLAIGAGGIRPCNIAFGADQFDTNTEKGRSQLKSFFDWWYLSFTVAVLIALTGVVLVQSNISWFWGFVIPTACLALSIIIFLIGNRTYVYVKPQGCVFLDMIKVVNAACRKRRLSLDPVLEQSLYDSPLKESEKQLSLLVHTDKFKCLDKAAVIANPSELNAEGVPKDSWRLCTVQQVERLKCLIGILPVWLTGILCFVTMDQMNTFGILQVIQSNTSIGNFKVPPGWMGLMSMISLAIWILIYECIYIPNMKKVSKKEVRFSVVLRIKIGIMMSILCMLVAGTVEIKRRAAALKDGSFVSPIIVAAFLPQFVLSGLTEAFAAVSIMEFFHNQMPESMRSAAGAIFFLSLSMASYLNTVIVNVVARLSGINGGKPWLGGHDLNANRLECLYFVIAGLGVLNFVYFSFFASQYANSDVFAHKRELPPMEQLPSDSVNPPKSKSEDNC